ncbi:hypothetical protein OAG46_00180 [Planctomycetota bacterium]|nr:hypothetical protein [Planctomycetota bacterium]
MANIKFSAFTELAPIDQGINGSYIVGYEGDANTNNRWTFGEVAIGLKAVTATPYSIYSASGALEATREVTFSAHDLKFIATGNGKLWYQDGNQAAGKVLKSDDYGEASWAAETDYNLPLAADGTRGGIQIGATGLAAKEYAVQLSSEKAYVAVPWVNTTYSTFTYDSSTPANSTSGLVPAPTTSGDNAKFLTGAATWATPTDTTYSAMTDSDFGLGKLKYATNSTPTAETQSTTANRTYGITENVSNQLVVNVPWTDTATDAAGTTGQIQYSDGSTPASFAASSNLTFTGSGATPDTLTLTDTLDIKGDGTDPGTLKLYCESTTTPHAVSILGPVHSGANPYSIRLPKEIATQTVYSSGGRILESDASGALQWIDTSNVTGNLYTTDGTIISGRKAKLAGTFQFRDSGDNSDLLTLNTNGNFALGLNAGPVTDSNCVTIGGNAQTNGSSSIAIGGATWSKVSGIAIGQTSYSAGTNISIGQQAGDYNTSNPGIVTIGNKVRPTGANSITLAARNSSASSIVPNVDNTFNVYLADASTVGAEDFQIVRSGESTLRTSLKVTGQAYTELNSLSNTLTVNWNDSNVQTISALTGAHTFTPTNPKAGATYILTLIQTGAVTATWGSYIKWAAPDSAATPPELSGSGKTDVITLICWSATANSGAGGYYGSITKDLS